MLLSSLMLSSSPMIPSLEESLLTQSMKEKIPPHFDIMEMAGWQTPYKQIISL